MTDTLYWRIKYFHVIKNKRKKNTPNKTLLDGYKTSTLKHLELLIILPITYRIYLCPETKGLFGYSLFLPECESYFFGTYFR